MASNRWIFPSIRPSSSDEQYINITGDKIGNYRKILDNILLLKKSGINITCQMPVNKFTINELIPISEWCYNNQIRFTFSNELTDSYYGECRQNDYVNDEVFQDYKNIIKQIPNIVSSKKFEIKKEFGYKHHFDCISGMHTYAISFNNHIRPCFNIWESDLISFDGNESMRSALLEMKNYIKEMHEKVIDGCHGCEAVNICNECLYTQQKHKNETNYSQLKCIENLNKLHIY